MVCNNMFVILYAEKLCFTSTLVMGDGCIFKTRQHFRGKMFDRRTLQVNILTLMYLDIFFKISKPLILVLILEHFFLINKLFSFSERLLIEFVTCLKVIENFVLIQV